MSALLYLFASAIVLAYFWVKARYNYWKQRGFDTVEVSFPFGSLKGVGTKINTAENLQNIYNSFKGKAQGVGIYYTLSPVFLAIEPELIKNILVRDFSSFHDRGFYFNKKDDPLSANILTMEGQDWRDRRVKLSPIFTSGKMKMMFEIVDGIAERFMNVIEKDLKSSSVIEMRSLAAKYTSDVIGNVAFGLECKCLEDPKSEFLKYGRKVFDISPFQIMKFFFTNGFPELSRKLKLGSNTPEVAEFFHSTFLQTLKYRSENNIQRNDFVSLLLGLKDSFTNDELAAESFLIYIGGFESSSTLMTFTMYELAVNPDIQEKLRDEINAAADADGKLNYDALLGSKYLEMVMNESLRKYPPLHNLTRKSTKEYSIPNTKLTIPKGTTVEISVYAMHRDPEYYPEPEKFDPERFTPENVKTRKPFTYLPFGEGSRNCIGLRFGLMQTKIAIAKLLQSYILSPSEKTPIPMKYLPAGVFLAPIDGMNLKLTKIAK